MIKSGLKVGDTAPDFSLPNQDGETVSLSDFAGKWRVVYFYPKDDTTGCTAEACGFRDRLTDLQAVNIEVLGISKDSVVSHKKFATKYHLNFPILADVDHKVIETYGAWQEKSMFGRKFLGIKRMTYVVNPDGKIVEIFPHVIPIGHEKQVLEVVLKN